MIIILGLIAFGVVYWLLTRGVEKAPTTMSEQELIDEGMTKSEARKELRSQRNEQRIHSSTLSQATRTSNQIARSVSKIAKKGRW
jgi:hypothetical protein